MYSSMRPSSARISSVGGCVVEARGLSSILSCASSSVTRGRSARSQRSDRADRSRADHQDVAPLHFVRRLY